MPGPLDRLHQDALVAGAGARDPLRDDPALLRDEPLQPFVVLVVDIHFFAFAEPADTLLAHLL